MDLRPRSAALLLFVLAVSVVACGDDGPDGYSDATREAFMNGCVEDDVDPDLVDVCECAYERVVDDVPFDEFRSIEQRLARGQTEVPDTVGTIIVDCIREVSARRS